MREIWENRDLFSKRLLFYCAIGFTVTVVIRAITGRNMVNDIRRQLPPL